MVFFSFTKRSRPPRDIQIETREERILRETGTKIKTMEQRERLKGLREREKIARLRGVQVGKGLAEFGKVGLTRPDFSVEQNALRQMFTRPDFSVEQNALRQMFGGGEHIWGVPDSETHVTIHHDLNPRQRGDNSTAELFGFG